MEVYFPIFLGIGLEKWDPYKKVNGVLQRKLDTLDEWMEVMIFLKIVKCLIALICGKTWSFLSQQPLLAEFRESLSLSSLNIKHLQLQITLIWSHTY